MYKKRAIKILVFLLGLALLLWITSAIFIPKNNSKEAGMEEHFANGILGEPSNTIDVLILGDSETYSAFTPLQIWQDTGYTVHVSATPAQKLDYSLTLLERTFENQKPKIVIMETLPIIREVVEHSPLETDMANAIPIFNYHDRWKSLNSSDLFSSPVYTWTDPYKGYRYNTYLNGVVAGNYMVPTKEAVKLTPTNIELMNDIYELCTENGAKLVLVSSPSKVNWNYKRHNAIESLAKELNCEYIDMNLINNVVGIDWTKDTRDKGDHLNHSGAVKATKFLSNYLVETGLLTDHRNDEAYKSWDDALEHYIKGTSKK